MISSFRVHIAAFVIGLLAAGVAAEGQQTSPQLVITSAVPDAGGETLSISGGNFTRGNLAARPFVTLDLIPLDVRVATDTLILVAAPVGAMPAGKYLLTVSRGPASADNDTLEMIVGAGPSAPVSGSATSTRGQPAPNESAGTAKPSADTVPSPITSSGPAAEVGDHKISIEDV